MLATASDSVQKMKLYVTTRMKCIHEMSTVYRAFKDDYIRHYGFIRRMRQSIDAYEIGLVRGILEEGVRRKQFTVTDIDLTSTTIVACAKGLEYDLAVSLDARALDRTVAQLLDILFHGIVRRGGTP
jgi:hypothetical protein